MVVSPRRAREIARTRQDILEAAARAFAARGFNGATMQDIAREAGYTAASLYSYFASKEEIINELFASIREERHAILDKGMPEGLTFRQKIELMLRRQLEFATKHHDAIRFFHFSGAATCESDPENRMTTFEMVGQEFGDFIRRNATKEELGGNDPLDLGLALAGMTHLFFLRWLRAGANYDGSAAIGQLLDLFFHGISGPPADKS